MSRRRLAPVALVTGVLLAACSSAGPGSTTGTVAFIPGYGPGGAATPTAVGPKGHTGGMQPIRVSLGETDATHMFINLSQTSASAGKMSFLVMNDGTRKHEFVVLAAETPAADFPIVSFEGEPNRIDEDAKGVTNVGETGDMEPGQQMMLTIDMAPGHYAVVCNLQGHYAMGMHQDFWVTPAA